MIRRRSEAGATTAVAANEDVVPASQLREAYSRIRELERLVGKKQMEIEILEAVRDAETVLAQLGEWFDDYNTRAPHSALGMRSPANYRAAVTLSSSR